MEAASDSEWVEDVKRWTGSGSVRTDAALDDSPDDLALGVEAAQPALQARHWPDAPTTDR